MAQRKLQSEIDRTIKKVAEGVEGFESTYDKLHQATNQTQKDKLEGDLKSQIKKLQRLRDQIKTWAASNDIKDKSMLQENRKLIEIQMEKFKACEKEMKTKAFSKGGLIAAAKLDPREKAKHEQSEWLGTMVTELERQVEQTEAELASLQQTVKKKSKNGSNGRADDLAHLNTRRQWHVNRLEIVMRLLENDTLTPDQVQDIREDVSYFVNNNQDDGFEEDEMIYDELNLDAEEGALGLMGDDGNTDEGSSMISDLPPRTPMKEKSARSSSHDDDSLGGRQNDHSPVLKKQPIPLRKPAEKPEPPKAPIPIPQPNFVAQPMSSALKAGLTNPSSAPVKPVMRYSAAAGGSSSTPNASLPPPPTPTTAATISQATPAPPGIPPPTPVLSNASSEPSTAQSPPRSSTPVSVPSPVASSIMPPSQSSRVSPPPATKSVASSGYPDSRGPSPPISSAAASPLVYSIASASLAASPYPPAAVEPPQPVNGTTKIPQAATLSSAQQQSFSNPLTAPVVTMSVTPNGTASVSSVPSNAPSNLGPSPLPQQVQQVTSPAIGTRPEVNQQQGTTLPSLYPPGVPVPPAATSDRSGGAPAGNVTGSLQHQAPSRPVLPGSLGDLVQSFEQVKSKAAQRMSNPDQVNLILEKSIIGTPQAHDTEKPKYYAPRNPYSTPPYYPQTPLSNLSSPALFAQLDVETLFYVFYFLPGTYMQYLAAHELKKQSWRFHVKYLTWFQRHSEPQAITEEYEQGVYVYFDWEGSWCQRKKSDFRFEYRYLSED